MGDLQKASRSQRLSNQGAFKASSGLADLSAAGNISCAKSMTTYAPLSLGAAPQDTCLYLLAQVRMHRLAANVGIQNERGHIVAHSASTACARHVSNSGFVVTSFSKRTSM